VCLRYLFLCRLLSVGILNCAGMIDFRKLSVLFNLFVFSQISCYVQLYVYMFTSQAHYPSKLIAMNCLGVEQQLQHCFQITLKVQNL
jgi:hypothetical protein